jgi:sensor histidine kinase regulating citrate/malate metabolism
VLETESLKKKIHVLSNKMQAVSGYLELKQYEKAKVELRKANTALADLRSYVLAHKAA